MTDVRVIQVATEVETHGPVRVIQAVTEVELSAPPRVVQVVVEVELPPPGEVEITQFVAEVEYSGEAGPIPLTQFVAEVEYRSGPIPVTQFVAEVDYTPEEVVLNQASFDLMAELVAPTETEDQFFLRALLKQPFTVVRSFNLNALIEEPWPPRFQLEAKLKKPDPEETIPYPFFCDYGTYEVRLLDYDGSVLHVIDQYTELEFERAVNGQFHHALGNYSLTGNATLLPTEDFLLDRIVQVRRINEGGEAVVVFEGFHRFSRTWHDEDGTAWFLSAGPDLKHLMYRRILLPRTEHEAFLSLIGPFTNIMRDMVRYSATDIGGDLDRAMPRLRVWPNDSYGVPLNLSYRFTQMNVELDKLTEVDIGADWDVYQTGAYLDFRVFYPYRGWDRTRGNTYGNPEMVWSIDRANIVEPAYNSDRLEEVTVVYVAGEGIGAARQIEERRNIVGRETDSPWNRIESFIENSRETSTAAIRATGDAHLVEHSQVQEFALKAASNQVLTYGCGWNLGDICTGEFAGNSFPCRIVRVREVLRKAEQSVPVIIPTFFVYPRLEDY